MVSKYKLCKIGASLGAAVGIIAFLWAFVAYFERIVSLGFTTFGYVWGAFTNTSISVGIVTTALFCAFVICVIVGESNEPHADTIFSIGFCFLIIWMLIVIGVFLDSIKPNVFPANSWIAVLPTIIAMLFLIFYYSDAFNFCDKFKKQEEK